MQAGDSAFSSVEHRPKREILPYSNSRLSKRVVKHFYKPDVSCLDYSSEYQDWSESRGLDLSSVRLFLVRIGNEAGRLR
jgi:hypothetical protein